MDIAYYGYGGVWGSDRWDAFLGRLDSRYSTELYRTYKNVASLPMPTDGSSGVFAGRIAGLSEDFANLSPYVNPEDGNPASTNSDQVWGTVVSMDVQTPWQLYSGAMGRGGLDELIIAQKAEWGEHVTRALANKAALESLDIMGGDPITTGPFTFTGTMPLPTAGTDESNPTIGATQEFTEADPYVWDVWTDSGGTLTHAGYILTGEGDTSETETGLEITVKKTFTKRWLVEKKVGFSKTRYVKTRDYANFTGTMTTYLFAQNGGGSIIIYAGGTYGTNPSESVQLAAYSAMISGVEASFGTVVSGCTILGWSANNPPAYVLGQLFYSCDTLRQVNDQWQTQFSQQTATIMTTYSSVITGQYHTETVGATEVEHTQISATEYVKRTGQSAKYIFTEETGIFGGIVFTAKKRV